MPLIVLFAILFPAVHSYEHILDTHSQKEKIEFSVSEKPQFKAKLHSFHKCSICDFKFSAVGTFEFGIFTFFKNATGGQGGKGRFFRNFDQKAGRSQNLQLKKLKRQGNTNASNRSQCVFAPLYLFAFI